MSRSKKFPKRLVVKEVNIENLNNNIFVSGVYEEAYIVFRYKNNVIGHSRFQVKSGVINVYDLYNFLPTLAENIWKIHFNSDSLQKYEYPSVSLVICTHDRTNDLKNCLESINNLLYENLEIIIIDNCPSNDSTRKLVEKYPSVIYIIEPNLGLDYARNKGLLVAKSDIIAFTDDDAVVDKYWLRELVKNFSDPSVGIVTGITMPNELETEAQILFEEISCFNRGFVKKEYDFLKINPVGAGQVGAGVNMAIRKSIVKEVGTFDVALDGGTVTYSGGDHEYFYRTLAKGYRIVYDPSALVWHTHRKNFESLKRTIYGYGVGVYSWWTRSLFREKEYSVIIVALCWFINYYIKRIIKSVLFLPNRIPFKYTLFELFGATIGPFNYLRSYYKSNKNQSKVLIS